MYYIRMKICAQQSLVDPAVEIGIRLRRYLERNGMTQVDAADLYKARQSWISRILRGDFTERSEVARKMCADADVPFLDEPFWAGRPRQRDRIRLLKALDAVGHVQHQSAYGIARALALLAKYPNDKKKSENRKVQSSSRVKRR